VTLANTRVNINIPDIGPLPTRLSEVPPYGAQVSHIEAEIQHVVCDTEWVARETAVLLSRGFFVLAAYPIEYGPGERRVQMDTASGMECTRVAILAQRLSR